MVKDTVLPTSQPLPSEVILRQDNLRAKKRALSLHIVYVGACELWMCVCRRSKDCIKICCRDEGLRRFFSFFLFLSFHPSFLEYTATVVFSSLKDVNKHSVTIFALPNTLVESSCYNHSCQEVMGGGGKAASQPSEQIWRKAGRLWVTLELVLELVSVSLSCRGLFDFF